MFDELMAIFEEYAEMELNPDDKIMELELDSLIMIDLRNTIEMKYKVDLKLNQMLKMSVGQAINFVIDRMGDKNNKENLIETTVDEEFALNDLQKAYWVGRSSEYELGNISTHVYVEFENKNLEFDKFKAAAKKLIERHEMLRAIITSEGKQRIIPMEEVDIDIPYKDLSVMEKEVRESLLINERNRMSHEVFEINSYPFFALQVFKVESALYRIYVSIDMLVADACSLSIFFRDLNYFYNEKENLLKPIDFNFRDYIANDVQLETSNKYTESDKYWEEKCKTIAPPPTLPLSKQPAEIVRPKFVHTQRIIGRKDYEKLKQKVKEKNITMPSLLLSVYFDVLSAWANGERFSINVTNLDRRKYSESVNDLIGQFASFTIFSSGGCKDKDFYEYASEVQQELWDDLDHRYIGGTKILQKLRQNSGNMGKALMPIVFTCILQDMAQTDWLGDIVYSVSQTSQIWLDNQTLERDGQLVLSWDYLSELFPDNMIDEMLDSYAKYIVSLANDKSPKRVDDETLLIRENGNKTEDNSKLVLVGELLEKAFSQYANNICLVDEKKRLTFEQTGKLTDCIAAYLRSRLEKENSNIVAILMDKSYKQIVSALGVIKAGFTYVPVDASLPKERINYILKDCNAAIVLTNSTEKKDQNTEVQKGIEWVEFDAVTSKESPSMSFRKVDEADSMYIIYTSGSTGNPTGVIVNHKGVGNAVAFTNERFNVTSNDVAIAMTPFHHDMSIFDIFGILSAGGKLVVPSDKARKDPAILADILIKEQVSIWNSVPSLMEVFTEYIINKPSKIPVFLRLVILGGDWISTDMCRRLFDVIHGLKIASVGGPTETTLWNIYHEFTSLAEDVKRIPYGKPIANTKYYVLDDDLRDCPNWVVGNICSTGVGVAAGYCNNEEKEKEKFILHPVTKEKMCVSGDLGRYRLDGSIEILGRRDNQIKINGVRIETEEIEAIIKKFAGIDNCVVACDQNNQKLLVAFIVAKDNKEKELKDYLKKKLPIYMVPKKFVWIDEIPCTANFKVDRKKLMSLVKEQHDVRKTNNLPMNALSDNEKIIGDIVMEVLEIDSLDYNDNISLLGGSSIELIKIINKLEKIYNHRMALEDFFENLTVRKLAEYFSNNGKVGKQSKTKDVKEENSKEFINNYEVLLDRHQREMFKMSNMGLRRDLNDRKIVELDKPNITADVVMQFSKRRSYRNYERKGISFSDFSNLLYWISNFDDKQYPNFLYASGGGLYSVQIYVYVMQYGIKELEQGFYYYDRNSHLLRCLAPNVDIKSDVHWSSNQAIYEESSFSIYLISDYDAVGPMYGNQGEHFATIEAGLLSEVLELKAPNYNIGLCQIGYMDFDKIKGYLELKETHIFIHTLIGGLVDFAGDYVAKQQTREYMKTEYFDGTQKQNNAVKGFIQAVKVQELKQLLEEEN